jgi:methylmalonyl-CoA/ethylmalonyl-CoA epimerase
MPGTKRQTGPKTPGKTKKASPAAARGGTKRAVPAAKKPANAKPAAKPITGKKPAANKPTTRTARPTTAATKPATRSSKPTAASRSAQARSAAKTPPRQAPLPAELPPLRRAADLSFALNKLHQVALLATDLDRSVAFYRDVLGLHYMDRYDPPGLAFFNLGSGVRLILSATSSKATLYFLVDDIDSAFRVLAQRGVSFLHKPSMIHRDDEGRLGKKGIEEWMAFFKDPSDNVLALVSRR